jgi:outer membrane lipoprotein-sorting protein
MKKLFFSVSCIISAFVFSGCSTDLALRDSDLSVKELEQKMAKALDPMGRFAAAERFIQRFEVQTSTGWMEPPKEEFVEVKFARPGNFKITTSDDKGLHHGYIFNDAGGYMINYRTKNVKPLDKELLSHLRTMREIADPVMELSSVFNHIEIKKGTLDNKDFYLLRCRKTPNGAPLELFISARDYRLRSLTGKIKIGSATLDYRSTVVDYARNEGMMVADLTKSVTNGIKTESKLSGFKLNPYFSPDEFKIPVF